MAVVQNEYDSMHKPVPEPKSIWLVVDDPLGLFADDKTLEELRKTLEGAARELVNSRIDQTRTPRPEPKYHSGITAVEKLKVTERLR